MEDVVKKIVETLQQGTKDEIQIFVMELKHEKSKEENANLWRNFIIQSIGNDILFSKEKFMSKISFVNARSLQEKLKGTSIMSIIWIDVGQKNEFRLDLTDDNGVTKSFIICRI